MLAGGRTCVSPSAPCRSKGRAGRRTCRPARRSPPIRSGGPAWCWRSSTAPLPERLGWIAAAAVVVLLNAYLWSGATAFMRASTEVGLLTTALVLATDRAAARRLLGAGLATGWALTAIAQLSKLG